MLIFSRNSSTDGNNIKLSAADSHQLIIHRRSYHLKTQSRLVGWQASLTISSINNCLIEQYKMLST